jgi:hypothetical protein
MPDSMFTGGDLAALRQLRAAVNEAWIAAADPYVVFVVLRALHMADSDEVPGMMLAYALRRLMACEIQPGGPYSAGGATTRKGAGAQPDVATNLAIAQFLRRYGVVLPELEAYLEVNVAHTNGVSAVAKGVSAADAHLLRLAVRVCAAAERRDQYPPVVEDSHNLHQRILTATRRRMSALPEPLRTTGLAVWEEMQRADRNHEIVLMPQLFADQLQNPSGITDRQLRLLGEANFFCWIATILYDDFIDEEGKPARLPIANVAYRLSLQLYRRMLTQPSLLGSGVAARRYAYVERIYTAVDRANAWEVMHARAQVMDGTITVNTLPHYGNRVVLADRAFGHTIGPMLLVRQLPGVHPRQVRLVQSALQHYLIARQLNDDIHDWRKDLRAGQLSVVVTDMLHAIRVRPGRYDVERLVARLERRFLRQGLDRQCIRLIEHSRACRRALAASGLTKPEGGFMRLVDDLEASALAAQRIRANEQAFLQAYRHLSESA